MKANDDGNNSVNGASVVPTVGKIISSNGSNCKKSVFSPLETHETKDEGIIDILFYF